MKALHLILPATVLASGAIFFSASNLSAYSFDGNLLSPFDRDFRVFNNFTDANANNNTTPSTNYPGALGAVMALWKGAAEWASQPMGNGQGDPTQPIIGSGNANFDAAFSGLATSSGVMGNNIMSELAGSQGGVLAFTELPGTPGGWRILFYSVWDWHDGPGSIVGGNSSFDLQGITCHEYGHALGLGHSGTAGTTMEASVSPLNTAIRSIEQDDINGVQALYGLKSASKLTITAFAGSGAPMRITGTNFGLGGNEVWFTPLSATASASAVPIKVGGLGSANGNTTIDVNVPPTAGKGMLIVRNTGIANGVGISNAFPFDPVACPAPLPYCTGKINSLGLVPEITFVGSNSLTISGGSMTIECNNGVPNKPGLFLHSDNGSATTPFQGGTLCLLGPIIRSPPFIFDTFGYCSQPLTFGAFEVGSYRWFQVWSRDPQSPDGIAVSLSRANQLKFCP
ncbi:MAG TPA: matrixin family metalloprotease [Planctomycetota bacterium]|nr:matrixin family metalloprotease [Planctomycetota bacterium]